MTAPDSFWQRQRGYLTRSSVTSVVAIVAGTIVLGSVAAGRFLWPTLLLIPLSPVLAWALGRDVHRSWNDDLRRGLREPTRHRQDGERDIGDLGPRR